MQDQDPQDKNIYGLVGKLCENILLRHSNENEDEVPHPYLPQRDNNKHLRKLKSKAYEILLGKSTQDYGLSNESKDPIIELLKFAFDLKVSQGYISQAVELQQYLDEFIDEELDSSSVTYSVLQFLNCLKSLNPQDTEKDSLDVFYFGRPHPQIPEMLNNTNGILPFQIYPSESFYLPPKFENKFREKSKSIGKFSLDQPGNALPLLGQFSICPNLEEQIGRYNSTTTCSSLSTIPQRTNQLLNGSNITLNYYFIPQIKNIEGSYEQLQEFQEGIVTEPETPWQNRDPLQIFIENCTEICEIKEDLDFINEAKIWENMDKQSSIITLTNHRNWETLGKFEPPKEPPFSSESVQATVHLVNVAKDLNIFINQSESMCQVKEISHEELIKHIKLLLLGLESNTFIYNPYTGFELQKNIHIHGISPETLENVCEEVTRYGTYYKKLMELIVPDPVTDKFKHDGLIFKALCGSLKEFLLFFHAAILKVTTTHNSSDSLLKFLHKIRPLGNLIFKVAELVQCESQRDSSLGEGICILTHIYKEVTKVTEQNVALIFYSILKDCCEVYFRFLQQWIFEGLCVDIYEEFMIKIRPQYTRSKTHRFWTRAFTVNKGSVPGFLSELTDKILQCGKAVTLLRICDPKNPLCQMSATSQPPVRVCLSVGMLREQAKFYEDYMEEGLRLQGEKVSMQSAIGEQKEAEKNRAELVIAAQRETLARLKKEREEAILKISKKKNELLQQLKSQAEESAQRKERDRDAELIADKIFLANFAKNELEAKLAEKAERQKTLDYYNELAEEVKRRRVQAESDKQSEVDSSKISVKLIPDTEETSNEDENSNPTSENVNSQNQESTSKAVRPSVLDITTDKQSEVDSSEMSVNLIPDTEETSNEDENSNPTSEKVNSQNQESISRAVRPSVLDITTDAQRNKLKVMQQEYGLVTSSNNNDSEVRKNLTRCLQEFEKDSADTTVPVPDENKELITEIEINRLRNTQHLTGFNLNEPEVMILSENLPLTDAQKNRYKIMLHTCTEELSSETLPKTPNNNAPELTDPTELSEIQINRLRNTQSNLNSDEPEIDFNKAVKSSDRKSEIELNRLRNTQHLTGFDIKEAESIDSSENLPLTDAQKNRNKVLSHFYMDEVEPKTAVKTENLTDWQKNRNRNMAHSTGQFDYDGFKSERESTPMSTATDYFTVSTNSGGENTPERKNSHSNCSDLGKSIDGMSMEDVPSPSRTSFKNFRDVPSFPNFIGFVPTMTTPLSQENNNQQLTAADVKMIDSTSLEVYLEKSVVIPLITQSRLVNSALIKHLLREHKMLSHLHSLRSFFFLLNGEFAKTLTQSLFTKLYKVSSPVELFNSTTLSNFLDNALVSSLSGTYANSELLSLSATNSPPYLQTSNPEVLNCLSLNYKMSWPLNIIFHDIVMQQYSKVFKFLLMVGRVLWVLEEDFYILKPSRKHDFVQNHHKLQLYRHAMMQFMNALHTYLTCSVLHASWTEFEKELENATTLDEVNNTHVSYIKKILSRCMLSASNETMRTCLCNIFKVVLKFHNRIKAQNWNSAAGDNVQPNWDNLERMYLAFCEQRAYLAKLANKLASSGYQPHLMQFLHALNINHRYDLTAKK